MKIELEKLRVLEKIFNDSAEQATEENALEIWENTIRRMIKISNKNLPRIWEKLNSFEKQLLTADKWFTFNEFKSLIIKNKSN